jgi:amino acid adenylation domain-containing protein
VSQAGTVPRRSAGSAQRALTPDRPASGAAAPPGEGTLQEVEHPLSPPQRRLWFLEQLFPGTPAYRTITGIRFRGALDVHALERALAELVTRHAVLRARLRDRDGEPVQVISPPAPIPLDRTDLRGRGADAEAEVRRLAREEVRRPLELRRDAMLRARLLSLAPDHHVLLLTIHHIVFDAWSREVLLRELAALYRSVCRPGVAALPPLPVEYVAYAARRRSDAVRARLERSRAWWKKRLQGCAIPSTPLWPDGPRPGTPSFEGARASVQIPAELDARIAELARREGTTVAIVLLAAFQTLLHRHADGDELVLGLLVAGRSEPETFPLIGLFVNELPLPLRLEKGDGFRAVLRRAHAAALGALAHQDLPLDELVRELAPAAPPGHSPLFQVAFNFKPGRQVELEFGSGLEASALTLDSGAAPFDLTLDVESEGEARTCHLDYPKGLFDPARMERMAGHYLNLLRGVVEDPDRPVAGLPLLDEGEREQLREWSQAPAPYPHGETIVSLLEAQVERSPGALALVTEREALTYRELDQRANRIARHLRSLGVGPEVVVGLAVERSAEVLAALFGILKAGGAYLPLDPAHPRDRVGHMLEDARVGVIVAARRPAWDPVVPGVEVVRLDDPARSRRIAAESAEAPERTATAGSLAYVIYTSGSTGRPKGVLIEHGSAVNMWCGFERTVLSHAPPRPLRISLDASLTFDASVEQVLCLLGGHTLHLAPEETRVDARAMVAYAREHALDVVDWVPTQMKLLLHSGLLDPAHPRPRVVVIGGEAVDEWTWRKLADAEGVESFNTYGPTECTVNATCSRITGSNARPHIGRPTLNTVAHVLDRNLQLAPAGAEGELCLGGDGLARGYLHRPELTAERFIPDPFGDRPGARLYRTGDRVRWARGGNLEFLGRADDQVKLRGLRIELGEIDATLSRHPEVQEAATVIQGSGDSGRLVGFVVPRDAGRTLRDHALRAFLRETLPGYMVPSVFVVLDALPRATSGKVDRRALAGLPAPPPAPAAPPRVLTGGERRVSIIWQELLGRHYFAPTDDFFEVGGHSLLAVRLVAEIEKSFGMPMPLSTLVKHSTLEGLSAQIEAGRPAELSHVVWFNEGGEGAPLFAITPFSGDALMFRQLAAALGPSQPVVSLQPVSLLGTRCQESVESAASELVGAIEGAQPFGPCHVLGYCVGGQIALEVARKLRSRGRTVAFLGLLDALRPGTRSTAEARARRAARRATRSGGQTSPGGHVMPVERRRHPLLRRIDRRLKHVLFRATFEVCRMLHLRQPAFLRNDEDLEEVVIYRHRPRPFPGPATLFLSTDERGALLPRDRGWARLVRGGLRVVDVSGDHVAILHQPNVVGLAKEIARALGPP